jgi:large subunit ribosomal protein L15
MKLHDLRPADGSHAARTRVGRGISAGKGKTAGRGTKGQKARAGGSIPPWFEGGQTPLHMRIPKLRGFKNRGKIEYEIVNVGDISARVEAGAFAGDGNAPKKGEPLTINADVLRAVGLVRDVRKPLKVLGGGDLSTALFVVADAFTKSATEKIEAAGGSVSVLEVPTKARPALGVDGASTAPPETPAVEAEAPTPATSPQEAPAKARAPRAPKAKAAATTDADSASAAIDDSAAAGDAVADEIAATSTGPDAAGDEDTSGADGPEATDSVTGDDSEADPAVPGDDA